MIAYTFVAENSAGLVLKEESVQAECYMDARRTFWNGLTDEQRDACASFECVDEAAGAA